MGFPDSVGGFEAALVAWEGLIEKWESASGNFLDEQVKVTVVMQKAPMTIRGFLQIQGITSYIRLREILVAYFLSQSTIADPMAGLVSGAGHQPMQVDALTKPKGKGKKGKTKDKGKVAHNPELVCYRCGRKGHYSRDCWSEQHIDGYPLDPPSKGKDKKGKGKGKGKVNEIGQNKFIEDIDQLRETVARLEQVSSSSSSTTMVRSLVQQAENYESQWQGGYVASVGQAMPQHVGPSVDVLVDNAADWSVCPLWFAPHVPLQAGTNPRLQTASEEPLRFHGVKHVPLYEQKTGKKIVIEFAVCDVHGAILSVGKFTEKHDNRTAWFTQNDAYLQFEDEHRMELAKENRHWVLKCTFSPPASWKGDYISGLQDDFGMDIAEPAHVAVGGGTTEPAHDAVGGGIEVSNEAILAETLPDGGIDLENFIKVRLPCREASVPARCNQCGDEMVYRTKCGLCDSHDCARSQWCDRHGPDAPPSPTWFDAEEDTAVKAEEAGLMQHPTEKQVDTAVEAVEAVEEKLEAKKEVQQETAASSSGPSARPAVRCKWCKAMAIASCKSCQCPLCKDCLYGTVCPGCAFIGEDAEQKGATEPVEEPSQQKGETKPVDSVV